MPNHLAIYVYLGCIVISCLAMLIAIVMVAIINRHGFSYPFSAPLVCGQYALGRRIQVIRILVVDDNPLVRRNMRSVLEQHDNWQVCGEASNGQEAVERFRQSRPDVIVLDFQMPQMNGLDAARIITHLSPGMPILMVTLYLSQQLREAARRIGVRGACAKANASCLVEGVAALLRKETYFPN
ncbi:MAG TPA: response regulator transcription factor [Candidatus Angelobacter sp.]|nr:response regulator transcription factor [Candidatus Angelobacter sp.]